MLNICFIMIYKALLVRKREASPLHGLVKGKLPLMELDMKAEDIKPSYKIFLKIGLLEQIR